MSELSPLELAAPTSFYLDMRGATRGKHILIESEVWSGPQDITSGIVDSVAIFPGAQVRHATSVFGITSSENIVAAPRFQTFTNPGKRLKLPPHPIFPEHASDSDWDAPAIRHLQDSLGRMREGHITHLRIGAIGMQSAWGLFGELLAASDQSVGAQVTSEVFFRALVLEDTRAQVLQQQNA